MTDDLKDDIEPVVSESRMRRTAIIIAVALFMQSLDSTVVTTALPVMSRSFHVDPLYMSVAITSYLISLSVFIPASGWVADRFGARQVFRIAVIIFTLGSMLCGISPDLLSLVAARVLQGLGGAMMVPVGRLLLLRSISRAQMVSAMAWLMIPSLLGPVIGPPLGGLIVSTISWRWIFFINVPIGLIGVVAVSLFIPDTREEGRGGKLDSIGIILSGLAMALLMIGMETIGRGLVSVYWSILAFIGGFVACGFYALHARYETNPVLDFSLMRIPTFSVSVLSGSLFRVAIGAMPFLLPMMLQLGFGESPFTSGLITFSAAAGALLMKTTARPILARFGFRAVLIWNGVIAASSVSVCALFNPGWPVWVMDILLFSTGFFRSLQFTAYNSIAYGDIPRTRMSAATTLYSTIQQISLTLGIVVGAATLEISAWAGGHHAPVRLDYVVAFLTISFIALCGVPLCSSLKANAGEQLSGHRQT